MIKVAFVGDSMGLRVRPKGDGNPYPYVVETSLRQKYGAVQVLNKHVGGSLLREHIVKNDEVIGFYPDYVVLSFNVEKYPRLLPRGFHYWLFIFSRVTFTNGNLKLNALTKAFRKFCKKIAPPLTKLFHLSSWCTPDAYELLLENYIQRLHTETKAKCILLVSEHVTKQAEQQLPRAMQMAKTYRNIMEKVATKTNALTIDLDQILQKESKGDIPSMERELLPDGYHLNGRLHQLVAKEICEKIEKASPKGKTQE